MVTGASRGIGLATARALCAEGASVLLVARSQDALETAADALPRSRWRRGRALACDVTDPTPASACSARRARALGEPDVLVNNAGTARWRDLDDVPDEDWQAAWEVNVMASHRAMRALVPGMRERGWGRVVNVSSTAGKRPSANMPEYSVAKAAQLSLSRLWADRCAADGVLVNAICPGPTKSELWVGEGGLADQSAALSGLAGPRGGDREVGRGPADRAPGRGRRDRGGDRVPLLGARVLRGRRRLERRRRHGAGDHLGAPPQEER